MARATRPRRCGFCQEGIDATDRRQRYHDECREPARLAGIAASRRCGKCKTVKQPDAFSNDSTRVGGKFPWCKTCQHIGTSSVVFQDVSADPNGHNCPLCGTAIRGHKNRRFCSRPCKERTGRLRERFGLTATEYNRMVSATGGVCPICLDPPTTWNVDHNHETGEVTGVVCGDCNRNALTASRHDVEYTRRLLAYLENPPSHRVGVDARAPITQPSKLHERWARGGRGAQEREAS